MMGSAKPNRQLQELLPGGNSSRPTGSLRCPLGVTQYTAHIVQKTTLRKEVKCAIYEVLRDPKKNHS